MSPGLDFAFGFVGDDYINKASERGWLLNNDSIATPATTSLTEDLQLRATLEPVKNLKIDLNASRTEDKGAQHTIHVRRHANDAERNAHHDHYKPRQRVRGHGATPPAATTRPRSRNSAARSTAFRDRVEAQYANATYPAGSALAGQKFDPKNGSVKQIQCRRHDTGVPLRLHLDGRQFARHIPPPCRACCPTGRCVTAALRSCRGSATCSRASTSTTPTRASTP